MSTYSFWSIGFSSFYTSVTARCYCAHFVLLFLPVVLASLVALVVPATPAFLAVLKRSKPCFLERSGAIRCTQLLSGTIRYYQGCSRTLYFQYGSTVHKRRNRHNAITAATAIFCCSNLNQTLGVVNMKTCLRSISSAWYILFLHLVFFLWTSTAQACCF